MALPTIFPWIRQLGYYPPGPPMGGEPRLERRHGPAARGSAAVGRYQDADERIAAPAFSTVANGSIEVLFEEFSNPFLAGLLLG